MNGLTLYRLGRMLTKLGEQAMPPSGFQQLPASVRAVLADVFEHPGSSITDITARTGFPQSHVSASVAQLREGGALRTVVDPADRRRTLVEPAPRSRRIAASIDAPIDDVLTAALTARLGPDGARHVGEVTAALEVLAAQLGPDAPEASA